MSYCILKDVNIQIAFMLGRSSQKRGVCYEDIDHLFLFIVFNLTLWSMEFIYIMYKNLVPASQDTHSLCLRKISWLMLFKEIITCYFQNRTEHTNTLCGQNVEIF
jgi:hypothetical protein